MDKWNLTGRFTVKEGPEGELSLFYEAGPGPVLILQLRPETTLPQAHELAGMLYECTRGVTLDFNYSPAAKLGFGPPED